MVGASGARRKGEARQRQASTYDINTSIPRNSDDGVEGTEVDTNDAHLCSNMTIECTSERVEESRFRERIVCFFVGSRRSSRK